MIKYYNLINSNNSHNEFVLKNSVLKEFDNIKKEENIISINNSLNYI